MKLVALELGGRGSLRASAASAARLGRSLALPGRRRVLPGNHWQRRAPLELLVLALEEPAHDQVFVAAEFAAVAAEEAFLLHAELVQHSAAGRITGEVVGIDSLQAEQVEAVGHDAPGGLRAIAVVPKGLADPVAHLGAVIDRVEREANGA